MKDKYNQYVVREIEKLVQNELDSILIESYETINYTVIKGSVPLVTV